MITMLEPVIGVTYDQLKFLSVIKVYRSRNEHTVDWILSMAQKRAGASERHIQLRITFLSH